MNDLLDNIIWHTLSGPHARFSSGTDKVRRYAPGFSPIIGFADPARPDLTALRAFCETDEHLYCSGWDAPAPPGWRIDEEGSMFRMVWDGVAPAADEWPAAIRLDGSHAAQALALASLTRPGPFGIRTIELGEYFGYFDGENLVAMAGERMQAGHLHEISGVCTHPDFQGKGLARRLMNKLINRQLQRHETPFLHVMSGNHNAHQLYLKMGFRDYCEVAVRVISPC